MQPPSEVLVSPGVSASGEVSGGLEGREEVREEELGEMRFEEREGSKRKSYGGRKKDPRKEKEECPRQEEEIQAAWEALGKREEIIDLKPRSPSPDVSLSVGKTEKKYGGSRPRRSAPPPELSNSGKDPGKKQPPSRQENSPEEPLDLSLPTRMRAREGQSECQTKVREDSRKEKEGKNQNKVKGGKEEIDKSISYSESPTMEEKPHKVQELQGYSETATTITIEDESLWQEIDQVRNEDLIVNFDVELFEF